LWWLLEARAGPLSLSLSCFRWFGGLEGTWSANYVFVIGFYIEGGIHVKKFVLCFDKVLDQSKLLDLSFWDVDLP